MRKWQVQVRSWFGVFVTLLDCCFILGVGFYCTVWCAANGAKAQWDNPRTRRYGGTAFLILEHRCRL
jgi:hypothetical protein